MAELSLGQRLKSGQHWSGGVGGTEPSWQTLKIQAISPHLLLQNDGSGQHWPGEQWISGPQMRFKMRIKWKLPLPGGTGAREPSGQLLRAHLTVLQSKVGWELITRTNIPRRKPWSSMVSCFWRNELNKRGLVDYWSVWPEAWILEYPRILVFPSLYCQENHKTQYGIDNVV